jgi:proliferating cell nuclear antigen
MKLMDIDSEHLEIPEVAYACSVTLPSSEFSRLMKDMANFGSTVTLHVKEDVFIVETTGDMGLATVTVKQDKVSKQPTEIECSSETKMRFPLNYLVIFTKAQNISEQVSLYLSDGIPIHVSYDMGDKGTIGYHLAPKLDE